MSQIQTNVQIPGEATIEFARHGANYIMVGTTNAVRGRKRGFTIITEPDFYYGEYQPAPELIERICSRVKAEYAPVAYEAVAAYAVDRDKFRALARQAKNILQGIAWDIKAEINE